MTRSDNRHHDGPFVMRHAVDLLTLLVLLFVIQTGTTPFDFTSPASPGEPVRAFGIATSSFTYPDIVSNLFLYVPVGACLYWSFRRRRRRWLSAAVWSLLLATALSVGIEWLQAYSPSRVSSLIDLTCNVLGAAIGTIIGVAVRWVGPRLRDSAMDEFRTRPHASLTVVYVGLLFFVAAMPFSLSLDPGLFHKSLKTASWVPFQVVFGDGVNPDATDQALGLHAHAYGKWRVMKCLSRWAAETTSFVVLVWLLYPLLRHYYKFRRTGGILMTIWLCTLLSCALGSVQFFSITRDFDVTDAIFRLVGMGIGLATVGAILDTKQYTQFEGLSDRISSVLTIGCTLTVIYILYIGVIPLTFSGEVGGLGRAVSAESFWPFTGYFVTRFDLMIDDVMEKAFCYALFAALFVSCRPSVARLSMSRRLVRVALLSVLISIPIEVVQAYIPVRVVSLTDPILAACGAICGVLLQEHAVKFYQFAVCSEVAARRHETMSSTDTAPSLTDSLMADLQDARSDAPAEPGFSEQPSNLHTPRS